MDTIDIQVACPDSMPIAVVLVGNKVGESVVAVDCMAEEDKAHDVEGYMEYRVVLLVLDAWESQTDHHYSSFS